MNGATGIRQIHPANETDLREVTRLHMELLDFGPMAALGVRFIRDMCYTTLMKDGLLRVALYEVEGVCAGFVAYTERSVTFHRALLRNHWVYTCWVLGLSILSDPRRLMKLVRAFRVLFSRRGEKEVLQDPLGEVVCIAVRPDYLKLGFVRRTGCRISEELVRYVISQVGRSGIERLRMIVDADNKAPLLLYHRLGARFERYEQAGEPRTVVWFHPRSATRADASPPTKKEAIERSTHDSQNKPLGQCESSSAYFPRVRSG